MLYGVIVVLRMIPKCIIEHLVVVRGCMLISDDFTDRERFVIGLSKRTG